MGKINKVKKKPNIILYTVLMAIVFIIITELLIWGYGGQLLVKSIFNYPQGSAIVHESILAMLVLIVMLIFHNSYVFTQKKANLKKGLFYGLFYIIGGLLFMTISIPGLITLKSGYALINVTILCLLIGICEEFLCRGWLLNEFLERFGDTKKGIWYSIIVSGLIFGLMHIANIFAGQDAIGTIMQVVSASATGIVLGLIYYKTKNIWSVIILHGFWDFSLFLKDIIPITERTASTVSFSVIGLIFSILSALAILMNIIPYIKDIDNEPSKDKVISFSVISIVLFLIFGMANGLTQTTIGETYKYKNLSLDEYAITNDNYSKYYINYRQENFTDVEELSFELYSNKDNNLVLRNNIIGDSILFECKNLYDYIILEEKEFYVIAYIDYADTDNVFINYNYLYKDKLSNDERYLDNVKKSMKKYLLPDVSKLIVVEDRDNNNSYVSAYNYDYGYFVLTKENEMAILNRD